MNSAGSYQAVRRAMLSLPCLVTCFVTLLCAPGTRADEPSSLTSERIVVLVSIDGLAAFYEDDPQAKMPTIRALIEQGAWAPMQASAPTVTWPNHTNLVTGTTSSGHGVVGNAYFDREQRREVALILDPEFDKEQIVRVPTIYDAAHAAGLKTAAVRWPATRNASTLDWTVPEVGTVEQLHRFTTPQLLAECKAAGIWSDGTLDRSKGKELLIMSDDSALDIFLHILQRHRPQLALLHLIRVDTMEHVHGPRSPEAYAAIEHADRQVKGVWETLQREFPGRATLFVVSDHGFSRIQHMLAPNVALRNLGLATVEGDQVVGGSVRAVVQGGAAMIYILDPDHREAIVTRLRKFFDDVPGIGKIAGPGQLSEHGVAEPSVDPHAPDMILFAADGYAFTAKATGSDVLVEEPEKQGTHGHDEHLPILHASLIAWGAGIRPGVRLNLVSNTCVAPTLARLLKLDLKQATGQSLDELLAP
ncbi:MAG: ectonucleotide pyrophosphatase/phosphodiesterase [Pirellulales bacterium]|nr:ectonucleotide pyrophosphatase/phosphodiesterase [Pirellulales bacterium]